MYEEVLIPTDGSDGMTEVLDHAVPLADCHQAEMHVLHVVDERQYLGAPDGTADQLKDSLHETGRDAIDDLVSIFEENDRRVTTELTEGIPYRSIIDYVEETDIDAIVMGKHGRTGRDRLENLGSVTERVLKNAQVPVLVIRIDE